MVLKLKREQQQQVLLSLISEVTQLESTRTICGNYQLKCQRQEYFLQKQKIVSSSNSVIFLLFSEVRVLLLFGNILQIFVYHSLIHYSSESLYLYRSR